MNAHLGPLIGLLAAFVSLAFLVIYDGLKERHRADLAMLVGLMAWMVDVFWHTNMLGPKPDLVDAFVDHFNFQFCLAAGTGLVLLAVSAYHQRIAMVWPLEAVGGGLLLAIWVASDRQGIWLLAWRGLTIMVTLVMVVALVSWVHARRDRHAGLVAGLSVLLMLCGVGGVLWHDQFLPWAGIGFYIYPPALLSLWWVVSGRLGAMHVPASRAASAPNDFQVSQSQLERERIAQDVHDGVGSHLTSILASLNPQDPQQRALMLSLEQCLLDLRITVDSMQDGMSASLPEALATLRYRLQPFLDRSGVVLHWRVRDHASMRLLPPASVLHCLRVAQEALANAIRHAHASELTLVCQYHEAGHHVELGIGDNGVGLDPDTLTQLAVGKGLRGMHRRAAEMGGVLDVFTRRGQGVRLTLFVPCGSAPKTPDLA